MTWDSPDRERPEQFCESSAPWEMLVAAIVKCACDDYKVYSGKGRQTIERFFRSEYFRTISNIDPDWLIKNLREMYPVKTPMIKGG